MSRQQLERARDLIKAKQYREARLLLKTINHPTAEKWLAKLERIDPPQYSLDDTQPGRRIYAQPEPKSSGNTIANMFLGAISLVSATIGIIVLIGLVIFVVQGTQTGAASEYGAMLPWAILTLVALPLAYVTRKMKR